MAIPRSGTCPKLLLNLRKLNPKETSQQVQSKADKAKFLNTYQMVANAEKKRIEELQANVMDMQNDQDRKKDEIGKLRSLIHAKNIKALAKRKRDIFNKTKETEEEQN